MILVDKSVVIATMDNYELEDGNIKIGDTVYMMGEVIDIAQPDYISPQKYCYEKGKGFYENSNFKELINVEETVNQQQKIIEQ
ncbi:MAG: hypothetical protein N4A63_04785 [Vallitalea sp.]|jgi:hypothetical protein|nr:hypothetical protein [Vallitalea sp.]